MISVQVRQSLYSHKALIYAVLLPVLSHSDVDLRSLIWSCHLVRCHKCHLTEREREMKER